MWPLTECYPWNKGLFGVAHQFPELQMTDTSNDRKSNLQMPEASYDRKNINAHPKEGVKFLFSSEATFNRKC